MSQALVLTLDSAGEPIFYEDNVECTGAGGGSRARLKPPAPHCVQFILPAVGWYAPEAHVSHATASDESALASVRFLPGTQAWHAICAAMSW